MFILYLLWKNNNHLILLVVLINNITYSGLLCIMLYNPFFNIFIINNAGFKFKFKKNPFIKNKLLLLLSVFNGH